MTIEEMFRKCLDIQKSKSQDYTSNPLISRHENFNRSRIIISWFKKDRDKVYATLIGTKMARLASLLSSDRTPNNESIEDNFLDIINYFSLWAEDCQKVEGEKRGFFDPLQNANPLISNKGLSEDRNQK